LTRAEQLLKFIILEPVARASLQSESNTTSTTGLFIIGVPSQSHFSKEDDIITCTEFFEFHELLEFWLPTAPHWNVFRKWGL
jgi:hypothetical protein